MTSPLSQDQFTQIVSDGWLTGDELLGLVSYYLNGPTPEKGLSNSYLNLQNYAAGWTAAAVSVPTNQDQFSLSKLTLKNADNASSLVLNSLQASRISTSTAASQNSLLSLDMTLSSGLAFSFDLEAKSENNISTQNQSGTELSTISFFESNGTTTTADDLKISFSTNRAWSTSPVKSTEKGDLKYSYSGNGYSIKFDETDDKTYTLDGSAAPVIKSVSGNEAIKYELVNPTSNTSGGFSAVIIEALVGGEIVRNINFSNIKYESGNVGLQMSASNAVYSTTAPLAFEPIGTQGPASAGVGFENLLPVFLDSANTLTLKGIAQINAGGGNDTIVGGYSSETIWDGDGNDSVVAGGGNDYLFAGRGNDTLQGDDGDDVITTFDPNLFPSSMAGKDVVDGGGGTDIVQFGKNEYEFQISKSGTDLVISDGGNHVVTVKNSVETVQFPYSSGEFSALHSGAASSSNDVLFQRGSGTYDDKTKTFTPTGSVLGFGFHVDGLAGNDRIFGTNITHISTGGRSIGDALFGGDGADELIGYGGNDLLDGGSGNDTLIGGEGSDIYIVDSASDQILGEVNTGFPATIADSTSYNVLQVRGDTSYDLKDQAIGFLTAGSFNKSQYENGGSESSWFDFQTTNKANIKGNDFGQRFAGNAAANKLEGMGGNDVIWGGAGNDTLDGGTGVDILDGGLGDDLLFGGTGDDYLSGVTYENNQWIISGKDTIDGGDGIDIVSLILADGAFSKSGSDLVFARVGNTSSTVTIRNNVETINVNGNTYSFLSLFNSAASKDSDVLYSGGTYNKYSRDYIPGNGISVLDGAAGDDIVYGSFVDDTLGGGDGADRVISFSGNDKLVGGVGRDTLIGGIGFDQYFVTDADDIIVEDPSDGGGQMGFDPNTGFIYAPSGSPSATGDTVVTSVSYSLLNEVGIENLFAAGAWTGDRSADSLAINLSGNLFGNTLIGNSAANILDGGGGSDFLFGGDGNDTILGGGGTDNLAGGAGNDSLIGGDGADSFFIDFNFGAANFFGFISGVVGAGGIDTILGGEGLDSLILSQAISGYSFIKASDSAVLVKNPQGADLATISGIEFISVGGVSYALNSFLGPSDFADELSASGSTSKFDRDGGKGNDTLFGSLNGDFLEGGEGDDFLTGGGSPGGQGTDTLLGGFGNDTLRIVLGVDTSTIADGGAGNDIYVLDTPVGLGYTQFFISDMSGTDTLSINLYTNQGIHSLSGGAYYGYIDGPMQQLNIMHRSNESPMSKIDVGLLESWELVLYEVSADGRVLVVDSQRANLIYASRDVKSGAWNAKGTDKDDLIWATKGGANIYDGGKGDDIIAIWPYADSVLQGGEGNNKLYGNGSDGTLSYAWASARVDVNLLGGFGIAFDAKGEEILALDEIYGLENVIGGKGGDNIAGNTKANLLNGSDGNDTISGGGGADVLVGGAGDDTFLIDLLNDVGTIASERQGAVVFSSNVGGIVTMTLQGGADTRGTDTLSLTGLRSYSDLRFLVGTSSVLIGTEQRSDWQQNFVTLADRAIEQVSFGIGSKSPVSLYATNWGNQGTKNNDLVLSRSGGGVALGGLGNDLLVGGRSADVLSGGLGNDLLVGQGGADKLLGGIGNDIIWVNPNDSDIAIGGAGSDTFVFELRQSEGPAGAPSQIMDFRLNEDFLRFEGISAFNYVYNGSVVYSAGVNSPVSINVAFDQSGLVLSMADGAAVRLVGIQVSDLEFLASRTQFGTIQ